MMSHGVIKSSILHLSVNQEASTKFFAGKKENLVTVFGLFVANLTRSLRANLFANNSITTFISASCLNTWPQ